MSSRTGGRDPNPLYPFGGGGGSTGMGQGSGAGGSGSSNTTVHFASGGIAVGAGGGGGGSAVVPGTVYLYDTSRVIDCGDYKLRVVEWWE